MRWQTEIRHYIQNRGTEAEIRLKLLTKRKHGQFQLADPRRRAHRRFRRTLKHESF